VPSPWQALSPGVPGSHDRRVDGAVGAVWVQGGQPRVVFGFTITQGKILEINLVAEPDRLRQLDLTILSD
jgi:hypothetical protein